jgi:hypothetical protein
VEQDGCRTRLLSGLLIDAESLLGLGRDLLLQERVGGGNEVIPERRPEIKDRIAYLTRQEEDLASADRSLCR